ncbi:M20/M25/M40 family metallo-hydrolase [Jiangella aurantiaca]|uniref:M20/M25/M40 family metallo-hydrolase n=1 Tax=Jiangella aurantiaca TaxID=2530373 RepID=A0A4R5A650_9ACTN|nr:M20/M25/M40 family metallo-hydrolase [Jiangella aurantiaca]TDD66466.1 M20/M25/M40 family metallo-hydrolase [Jiangella aurantiaca]
MTQTPAAPPSSADAEVVDLCRDLLRIDTSNFGDSSGPGERKAAEYVAEKLAEVGLDPVVFESEPGRTTVVARVEGADPGRSDALLMHGHLDVVPADADDWTHDPFSGEIADDCLWGRGAVDMKDMDAMILAVVRHRLRTGRRPARPLILAFLADEEAGGGLGAHWAVDHRPELFEGATEAISEVGGFSLTVNDDLRLYLVETAEKGIDWMKLTVTGRAGHGSMVSANNAVTELAEAVARVGRYQWPVRLTPTVRSFLEEAGQAFGFEFDPDDPERLLGQLGNLGRIIGATLRNSTNPTMLRAGYKHNVIPGRAEAYIDGRFLPGQEAEFAATLDELLGPNVQRESLVHDIAVETSFDGPLVDAMSAALLSEDPGARTVPYCMSGGTDAKSFSLLGIRNFGFAPLRLPPDLDFAGMFHGVDERVPVDGLGFGARVLDRFLDLA